MVQYECYETGIIVEKPYDFPGLFSTEKKYSVLYREELPRFQKQPLNMYALPYSDEPVKIYNGLGRMGLDETGSLNPSVKELSTDDIECLMLDEKSALVFLSSCNNADEYELVWSKISGSNENIPDGYKFIGYDISYPPYCDGAFSIICDCLFICRWHGCDIEGTLFLDDFNKLNEN